MGQCLTAIGVVSGDPNLTPAERAIMKKHEKEAKAKQLRELKALEETMPEEWKSKAQERLHKQRGKAMNKRIEIAEQYKAEQEILAGRQKFAEEQIMKEYNAKEEEMALKESVAAAEAQFLREHKVKQAAWDAVEAEELLGIKEMKENARGTNDEKLKAAIKKAEEKFKKAHQEFAEKMILAEREMYQKIQKLKEKATLAKWKAEEQAEACCTCFSRMKEYRTKSAEGVVLCKKG